MTLVFSRILPADRTVRKCPLWTACLPSGSGYSWGQSGNLGREALRTWEGTLWRDFSKEVKPTGDPGRYAATYVVC